MNSSIDMLTELFGGPGRVAILRLLSSDAGALTGRQVAELTGLSPAGAARALDRLASVGVVSRRAVGRAVLHELRRENYFVQTLLLPALEAEQRFLGDLSQSLASCLGDTASSITIFGSVARGEAGADSDIDVLVIVDGEQDAIVAQSAVDDMSQSIYSRYSLPLSAFIMTSNDVRGSKSAHVKQARDEGILIFGRSLKELMEA